MPRKAKQPRDGEQESEAGARAANGAEAAQDAGGADSTEGTASEPGAFNPLQPPRDLITAYLLLLLRNWNMHGYQLMQELMKFGFRPTDPGSIYRLLRQLEKQGYVRSNWEAGEAGPARRTYTLTDAGEAFLSTWAAAIESYQKTLKFWSDLYTGMVMPPRRDG